MAEAASESVTVNIPKLENGNYFAWHMRVKAFMIDKNCWNAIEPGFPDPMNADQQRLNRKALSILYRSVGDDFLLDIENCELVKTAWEILEEIHTTSTKFHALQSLKEMGNITKTEDMNMQEYTDNIQRLNEKVGKGGIAFSDELVANLFLAGLPAKECEVFVQNVLKEENLTTRLVKGRMLDEERRRQQQNGSETEATALAAAKGKDGKYFKNNQQKQNHSKTSQNEGTATVKTCYQCNQTGHIRKYCPTVDCEKCGKWGHWASDCKNEKAENTSSVDQNKKGPVVACVSVCALLSSSNHYQWYLDSAATEHMTSKKELFENFVPVNGRVSFGKGSTVVKGKGTVSVVLSDMNGGCTLQMNDVLYVPELRFNLVSVSKLTAHDVNVCFLSDKAEASKGSITVFTAFKKHDLYVLESAEVIPGDDQVAAIVTGAEAECESKDDATEAVALRSASTWHRSLGHVNVNAIQKIPGLENVKTDGKDQNECSVCIQGKLSKTTVPKKSERKSEKPLDLVHSDLMCLPIVSNGGARYLMSFIDDYSRYAVVKLLKRKSEAFSKFKQYKVEVELFHGNKLKAFQTDGGGEYYSNEFKDYLANRGIAHRCTVPHSPHQNGIAERYNRVIGDMVRCLLLESGMPDKFWAEAANTACVIRNLCPSMAVDNCVPAALWKGGDVSQDVLRLRVFGCRAWLAQNKGKLEPRAAEHVFLGYEPNVKGVRLYNMLTKKIVIGLHVKFEENVFPFQSNVSSKEKCVEKYVSISDSDENDESVNSDDDVNIANVDVMNVDHVNTTNENAHVSGPRRSSRLQKLKKCGCCNLTTCDSEKNEIGCLYQVTEPSSVKEAMSGKNADEWRKAMHLEYKQMLDLGVWEIVERPVDHKVIGSKWVFKVKYDECANVERFKARLVAQGFKSQMGFSWEDTFSPVIRKKSVRVLLALAVENQWSVHHMDVTCAYLNSPISQNVFMEQPELYEDRDGRRDGFVCKLKRSIYGLPCASKDWNFCLDGVLKELHFKRCRSDSCVYVGGGVITGVYVDDMILLGDEDKVCNFKRVFSGTLTVRDLGNVTKLLSMQICQDDCCTLFISQSLYIKKLLSECNMTDCKPCTAPLPMIEEVDDKPFEDDRFYRKVVGSLLFIANNYRCDIAFAVSRVSQACKAPIEGNWKSVKHILRYLQGTSDLCLHYERKGEPIRVYCDASWNSEPKGKSVGGFVVLFAGGAITWYSKKQSMSAMSTEEAEYISMSEAVREIKWLKNLFFELGQSVYIERPCTVWCDNTQAIVLGDTGSVSERSKHIDLKYHVCCEQVEIGNVVFYYVPSHENVGDIFTKTVSGPKMKSFFTKLGLVSYPKI